MPGTIPFDSLSAYPPGPARIFATEPGLDYPNYAAWRAGVLASGPHPANNRIFSDGAGFVLDPFIGDRQVLHLPTLETYYDPFGPYSFLMKLDHTVNGAGFPPDPAGRKIIWARMMLGYEPGFALDPLADTGFFWIPDCGPGLANSSNENQSLNMGFYPTTGKWASAASGEIVDISAEDCLADIAAAKAAYKSVIVKMDISGGSGGSPYELRSWFHARPLGAYPAIPDVNFVELGGLIARVTAGIDTFNYVPLASGGAYVRVIEFVDGAIDPTPYDFNPSPAVSYRSCMRPRCSRAI